MTTKSVLEAGLYTIKEIPDFLRFNEFIHSGYRMNFSRSQCIKSIFMMTNETVNIWSHLIGTFIFIVLLYQINNFLLQYKSSSIQDHIIVTAFCLTFVCCLFFSSLYHIFNCHSKELSDSCLRLDLLGICISLCGTYLPAIYYAFYCSKFWRTFYSGVVIAMIVANVLIQICPRRIYTEKRDNKRIALFVLLVIFGVVPAIHWILLMGGLSNPLAQEFIPQIFVMYMLAGIAFLFYSSKIPERFLPGYCDYIGHSHQFWHVFILSCFLWWYSCSFNLIKYRLDGTYACK